MDSNNNQFQSKQKDLTGKLKKNAKREKDSHPHYKGTCTINGSRFWISAWINEDEQTHEKYMGLRFAPITDQPQQPARPSKLPTDTGSDDVPF